MHCYKVFLAAAILMSCQPSALGNTPADEFQTDVVVKDRSNEVLQEALQVALEQVLVKASGDPEVAGQATVHDQLTSAQNFVERYEYLSDPNDSSHQKLILHVKFSSKSVREILDQKNTVQDEDIASEDGWTIHVYGINGLNDFSDVVDYVRALSSVISVEASTVDADDVILTVKSTAGIDALKKAIAAASDHRLQSYVADKKNQEDEVSASLTYRWVAAPATINE